MAVLLANAADGIPVATIPGRRFARNLDMGGDLIPGDPLAGPCWLWTGSLNDRGYAVFRLSPNRLVYAHIWAWEQANGLTAPPGMQIDHICHDYTRCTSASACLHRHCVNPAHLRCVTAAENNLRSGSPPAINARKTACDSGHPLSGDNLYLHPQRGTRHCRECQRIRAREWAARQSRDAMKVGRERGLAARRVDVQTQRRDVPRLAVPKR